MKTLGIILFLILPMQWISAQGLKPYVLGFETTESVADIKGKVISNLEKNNLEVVGQYQPAADENR